MSIYEKAKSLCPSSGGCITYKCVLKMIAILEIIGAIFGATSPIAGAFGVVLAAFIGAIIVLSLVVVAMIFLSRLQHMFPDHRNHTH